MLNHQYLPLFGATGAGVEFDYVYPMPSNREQDSLELTAKSTAAGALVLAGYDPGDVLETVGLPAMKVAPKPPPSGLPPGTPGAGMGAPGQPAAIPGEAGQGGDAENSTRRLAAWDAIEVLARQQAAWNSLAGAK